jgi:Trypsin-co-occurring domain 1
MGKFLEFESTDGSILFEVTPGRGEVAAVNKAGELLEKVAISMGEVFGIVAGVARGFHEAIKDAPVDSAKLEFGLQFTAKGRLYVVESEAQSAIKVTLDVTPHRQDP